MPTTDEFGGFHPTLTIKTPYKYGIVYTEYVLIYLDENIHVANFNIYKYRYQCQTFWSKFGILIGPNEQELKIHQQNIEQTIRIYGFQKQHWVSSVSIAAWKKYNTNASK